MKKLGAFLSIIAVLLFTVAAQPAPTTSAAPEAPPATALPAAAAGGSQPPPATAEPDPAGAPAPQPPSTSAPPGASAGASASAGPKPKPSNVKDWLQANPRATRGAILGAMSGALLGALSARLRGGSVGKGAAIGAAAGGVTGFLVGRSRDALAAGREQAIRRAAYDPSQGYVLRLEEVKAEPSSLAPGGTATLSVRYLVIGPNPDEKITVHCFRGLKYQDDYMTGDGPAAFVVSNGGGIVISSSPITLPKEAPPGSYVVEELLEDPQGRFHQSATAPLYVVSGNG
jgi:hypothetical protein